MFRVGIEWISILENPSNLTWYKQGVTLALLFLYSLGTNEVDLLFEESFKLNYPVSRFGVDLHFGYPIISLPLLE